MKIMATLECSECGEVWTISKEIEELDEEEDLYCCGQKATIKKGFRGEGDEPEDEIQM